MRVVEGLFGLTRQHFRTVGGFLTAPRLIYTMAPFDLPAGHRPASLVTMGGRQPVEQRINSIGSADELIRYAVAAQLSRLSEDIPHGAVAEAAGMSQSSLSNKLTGVQSDGTERTFDYQQLRALDQAFTALSPRSARPRLQHVGGLRSLGARVRSLDISEVLADAPAEWTDEWVRDDAPPRTEFELLGQASALLNTFMTASRAGRRELEVQAAFADPTKWTAQRLIMLGGSPPTSRNVDALIVLGGLTRYSFRRVSQILERAIRDSPLGFRAWRAVSKLVRIKREPDSEIDRELRRWVPRLLKDAEELRPKSLYPGRSLDLEVAANVPQEWAPAEIRDFLYARARSQKVTPRERGTAAHVMWTRAVEQNDAHYLDETRQLLHRVIAQFLKRPRADVTAGERWVATTLETVMEQGIQVCDHFPDIGEEWQQVAQSHLSAISASPLPRHLTSATQFLAEHAIFQNSGVERRRAIDTLQAAGLLDVVTRAFADIIKDSDQTWLRIRAIFALGFLQDPSQLVQQTLVVGVQVEE